MKSLRGSILVSISLATGLLLWAGCPADDDDSADEVPAEYTAADAARGGQMYDKFWKVDGVTASEPTSDHSLWASRPDQTSNERTGADTWRCKECHGWDYIGVDGRYSSGSHKTGFDGIYPASLEPQAAFDEIKGNHGYGAAGLSDGDIWDLTKFSLEGLIDISDIMNSSGAFTGNASNGQTLYDGGIGSNIGCASCHGADGLTPPEGHPDFDAWPGYLSNDNPQEFQHKVFFGHPGTDMPAAYAVNASLSDVNDVSTYSQTLPEAPAG